MNLKRSLFCVLLAAASVAVADEKHNGNWWIAQPPTAKAVYLQGYLDGLAEESSSWTMDAAMASVVVPKVCHQPLTGMQKRVEEGNKRFNDITYGQLIDGLNDFYADYRNRLIRVPVASNSVVSNIRGTPADIYQKTVEMARKVESD
jgi:hypothetical protein